MISGKFIELCNYDHNPICHNLLIENICQPSNIPQVHLQLIPVSTPSPRQSFVDFLSIWICFFGTFRTMGSYNVWSFVSDVFHLAKCFLRFIHVEGSISI